MANKMNFGNAIKKTATIVIGAGLSKFVTNKVNQSIGDKIPKFGIPVAKLVVAGYVDMKAKNPMIKDAMTGVIAQAGLELFALYMPEQMAGNDSVDGIGADYYVEEQVGSAYGSMYGPDEDSENAVNGEGLPTSIGDLPDSL